MRPTNSVDAIRKASVDLLDPDSSTPVRVAINTPLFKEIVGLLGTYNLPVEMDTELTMRLWLETCLSSSELLYPDGRTVPCGLNYKDVRYYIARFFERFDPLHFTVPSKSVKAEDRLSNIRLLDIIGSL